MTTSITRPQRRRRSIGAAFAAVLAASVAVACSPTGGSLGSLPPRPSAEPPSVAPASPDATPQLPSPTAPAGSPSASPVGSPAPSPSAPVATTVVRAYFFLPGDRGEPGLVAVLREVPRTVAVATAAMEQLLAGPTGSEAADGSLSTAIPAGTRLLGIAIDGGVATVDLSREFEAGGGSESVFGRLAQVVYTLTQFPTVESVRFELDGRPVQVFGGEGLVLDGPVGREDYREQLPEIFVDRPVWGAAAGNPARITGLTRVFEATFRAQLLDSRGLALAEEVVMATCGTGCWGTFEVTLDYDVPRAQWGTLRVYEPSAQDGSPVNVRDYPIWLTPRS